MIEEVFKMAGGAARFGLEVPVAATEINLGLNPAANALVRSKFPHGDGRPVITLPGFMASGLTLLPLNQFLKKSGYNVRGTSMLWPNLGPRFTDYDGIVENALKFQQENDGRKITLIGQSLGGVNAQRLVKMLQEEGAIDSVITLGSPINPSVLGERDEKLNSGVTQIFDGLNNPDHPKVQEFMSDMEGILRHGLPDVSVTAIHSSLDQVVGSQAAQTSLVGNRKQNVRVWSSHIGMGVSPITKIVMLDVLSQAPDSFEPFDAGKYGPLIKRLYPDGGGIASKAQENDAALVAA